MGFFAGSALEFYCNDIFALFERYSNPIVVEVRRVADGITFFKGIQHFFTIYIQSEKVISSNAESMSFGCRCIHYRESPAGIANLAFREEIRKIQQIAGTGYQ